VFENRVLRKIFIPKEEELAQGQRRRHNENLHNFTSPSIIRVIKPREMKQAHMEEMRNLYKILVRKSEGKRSLKRPRCRREGDIKMDPSGT